MFSRSAASALLATSSPVFATPSPLPPLLRRGEAQTGDRLAASPSLGRGTEGEAGRGATSEGVTP